MMSCLFYLLNLKLSRTTSVGVVFTFYLQQCIKAIIDKKKEELRSGKKKQFIFQFIFDFSLIFYF